MKKKLLNPAMYGVPCRRVQFIGLQVMDVYASSAFQVVEVA
jgi:hypothetical protein